MNPGNRERRRALAAALLVAAVGLLPWREWFDEVSYDLLVAFSPRQSVEQAYIIRMDESALQKFGQKPADWDRALHAKLVEKLTADNVRLIVFDVSFFNRGEDASTHSLEKAINESGRVVLGASLEQDGGDDAKQFFNLPRLDLAGANVGIGLVDLYDDFRLSRAIFPGSRDSSGQFLPGLAWAAAEKYGIGRPADIFRDRWLNYYGPPGTIPGMSYSVVFDRPAGTFSNKVVFVGGHPKARDLHDRVDEFKTPYSRWGYRHSSGVEIHAMAFLNLIQGDYLTEISAGWELLLFAVVGGLWGYCSMAIRPQRVLVAAALLALGAFALACLLSWRTGFWYSWSFFVLLQIPVGLGCSFYNWAKKPTQPGGSQESKDEESSREAEENSATLVEKKVLSEHTLLHRVGSGAFGEVWLARHKDIPVFRAIKIICRANFSEDGPYERAFKGIINYVPISTGHDALLPIFHAVRNDAERFFYYIMEIADDEITGKEINPSSYEPKSLAHLLRRKGLALREALEIGISLTAALEHLHKKGLVHRDLKPANVVFVRGIPKVADIDLIADNGR
jgi:CHASE2 domain-containing sensor protein